MTCLAAAQPRTKQQRPQLTVRGRQPLEQRDLFLGENVLGSALRMPHLGDTVHRRPVQAFVHFGPLEELVVDRPVDMPGPLRDKAELIVDVGVGEPVDRRVRIRSQQGRDGAGVCVEGAIRLAFQF